MALGRSSMQHPTAWSNDPPPSRNLHSELAIPFRGIDRLVIFPLRALKHDGETDAKRRAALVTNTLRDCSAPMRVAAWCVCTRVDERLLLCPPKYHGEDEDM